MFLHITSHFDVEVFKGISEFLGVLRVVRITENVSNRLVLHEHSIGHYLKHDSGTFWY